MQDNTSGLIPSCMVAIGDNKYICINSGKVITTQILPIHRCIFCAKTQPPSILQKVRNLATSLAEHAQNSFKNVSQEQYEERIKICNSNQCGYYEKGRCNKCGCVLGIKAWWEAMHCDLGLWPSWGNHPMSGENPKKE